MKKFAPLSVFIWASLLVQCSDTQSVECGAGQAVGDDGRCVDIPCEGGDIVGTMCVCPGDQVLDAGRCRDPEDPCIGVTCDDENECTTDSCEAGVCGNDNVSDGTTCDAEGSDGLCMSGACKPELCADDPCDDGNECKVGGVCNLSTGICEGRDNAPTRVTACTQDGGTFCDGSGNCVQCIDAETDCTPGGPCTATTCIGGKCNTSSLTSGETCDASGPDAGDGLCSAEGLCVASTCTPPCVDNDDNCYATTCEGTVCNDEGVFVTEGILCKIDGIDGKCDGAGICDLCFEKDCASDNDCVEDGVCDDSTGECIVGDNLEDLTRCDQSRGVCLAGNCGTVFPCTEDGINDAIAFAGEGGYTGGALTFDCNSGDVIPLQETVVIDQDVHLDGGGLLRLGGQDERQVVQVAAEKTVTLERISIEDGHTTNDGAGINNQGKLLTLANVIVSSSVADSEGGGIYNAEGSELKLENVVVKDNEAKEEGGGIWNGGSLSTTCDPDDLNTCPPINQSTAPQLTIHNNKAPQQGGGIRNSGADALMSIALALIEDNDATGTTAGNGNGAGIFNGRGGTLKVWYSTIKSNTAQRNGGALYNTARAEISQSLIYANIAKTGNGAGVSNEGNLTIENSTLTRNDAQGVESYVGGLFNTSTGVARLTFVTEWENFAMDILNALFARGIRNTGTLTVEASIVMGSCSGEAWAAASRHNAISSADCRDKVDTSDAANNPDLTVTPLLNDGTLSDLSKHGGPTENYRPANQSLNLVPGTFSGCGTTKFDQRGFPRRTEGADRCDAGSVEEQ